MWVLARDTVFPRRLAYVEMRHKGLAFGVIVSNVGAYMITNTILGAPCHSYSIMYPKTLF